MAYYGKFKLPPLRVTKCVSGSSSADLINRRCHYVQADMSKSEKENQSNLPSVDHDFDEPSAHEIERQSASSKWQMLRSKLLTAAVESASLPPNQLCIVCCQLASFRCLECGPGVYYCSEYFCKVHEKMNFFHIAEKWEACSSM